MFLSNFLLSNSLIVYLFFLFVDSIEKKYGYLRELVWWIEYLTVLDFEFQSMEDFRVRIADEHGSSKLHDVVKTSVSVENHQIALQTADAIEVYDFVTGQFLDSLIQTSSTTITR